MLNVIKCRQQVVRHQQKPFGGKTVLLPCRNDPLEERKVVTAAFFPVSGNEGMIVMSKNHGQFCPGWLLSGFESCARQIWFFFCKSCWWNSARISLLGLLVCIYGGWQWLSLNFPSMLFMFLFVWFFLSVYQKRCVLFTTNLAAGLVSALDLEFFL